jgi:hypothetical protein
VYAMLRFLEEANCGCSRRRPPSPYSADKLFPAQGYIHQIVEIVVLSHRLAR